jgi:hypothetical protein
MALSLLLAALPPAHFIVRERQRPGDGQGRAAEVVCRGGRRGAVFLRATEKARRLASEKIAGIAQSTEQVAHADGGGHDDTSTSPRTSPRTPPPTRAWTSVVD